MALPYGLALAKLMGLPPEFGLFTSILTAPVTSLLGRNPVLIGGTASATVPFIAAAVATQGPGGAAKVCLAASVFMMIFCVLRLGRYVAKVPHPVVSGFSCGVGAMMVILQLRTLLGLPASPGGRADTSLAELLSITKILSHTRWEPLLLGLLVVAGAVVAARRWPQITGASARRRACGRCRRCVRMARAPAGCGVVVATLVCRLHLGTRRCDRSLAERLGLAFVASVNILITSRVVEHFQGRHRPLRGADADAELGAYGIANLFAGVVGAPLSVGIPARSLANLRCGGTTRLSNLLHAVFLLMFASFGAGLIARIPLAALAGVTAYVGLGLLEWSTWRRLPRMRRLDAAAFLATAAAVLSTNAVAAVAIGCSFYVLRQLVVRLTPEQSLPALGPRNVDF